MAILVDFNQIIIANASVYHRHVSPDLKVSGIRNLFMNELLTLQKKFGKDYGDFVIACDHQHRWREEFFPYYKDNRAKARAKSPMDWDIIFEAVNTIREEMDRWFPYPVIHVEGAEGDDVIAVLCRHFYDNPPKFDDNGEPKLVESEPNPVLIVSEDGDFKQLQIMSNVDQWSVSNKKMIRENRPDLFLREHIIRGDRGDGVPNFLSGDDWLVCKKRQKPIQQKKLDKWIEIDRPEDFGEDIGDEEIENWYRNQKMIDLVGDQIPKDLQDRIIEAYNSAHREPKSSLLNYAIKFKVRVLAEEIAHF